MLGGVGLLLTLLRQVLNFQTVVLSPLLARPTYFLLLLAKLLLEAADRRGANRVLAV